MSEEKKELTKQEERNLFVKEKQDSVSKILFESGLFLGEVSQIIRNLSLMIDSIKLDKPSKETKSDVKENKTTEETK